MKNKILLLIINFLILQQVNATQIPFTQDDKERLIRLEIKMEEGFKSLDYRFQAIDKKFEALDTKFEAINSKFEAIDSKFEGIQNQLNLISALIVTLVAGVLGSVAYMWWDRRLANAPIKEEIETEKRKYNTLVVALKEYSMNHPDLKKIFDNAAIL